MAGPNDILSKGFVATTAIPKFHPVKFSGENTIEVCDTKGELAIGVCQEEITAEDVADGRVAAVRMFGISHCIANGALSRQVKVAVQANGKVDTAVATEHVVGVTMNDATEDDWVPVALTLGTALET